MAFLLPSLFGYECENPEWGTCDELTRVSLKDVDTNAVCNDGSEAIYFWKKSQTDSNRWLIMLLGTEGCNKD